MRDDDDQAFRQLDNSNELLPIIELQNLRLTVLLNELFDEFGSGASLLGRESLRPRVLRKAVDNVKDVKRLCSRTLLASVFHRMLLGCANPRTRRSCAWRK
jgi:hypothetical protein